MSTLSSTQLGWTLQQNAMREDRTLVIFSIQRYYSPQLTELRFVSTATEGGLVQQCY